MQFRPRCSQKGLLGMCDLPKGHEGKCTTITMNPRTGTRKAIAIHPARTALIILVALIVSSCRLVGGDSSAAGLAQFSGQEPGVHTRSGCGWTGDNGWPIPCNVPLSPTQEDVIFLGVSLWDVFADDLEPYRTATDYYTSRGVDVVWAAMPPHTVPDVGWTQEVVDAHNAAVAIELGCALLPPWVRDAETFDGLHYTPAGAQVVLARYELVDVDEWKCE